MRRGLALLGLYAVACGPARDATPPPREPAAASPIADSPSPSPDAVVSAPEPIDSAPIDALAALHLLASEGSIAIRTDVLRGHPVGAHLGAVVGAWPGWRATIRVLARDPVTDLDWMIVVGPADPKGQRLLARVAPSAPDGALEGRLVAAQARSAEPAASHVEAGLPAAAARLDGVLRVVFRARRLSVAAMPATPASQGLVASHELARSEVHLPDMPPLEAVRVDVPDPHAWVREVPGGIRQIRARITALASGDAEATATGDCANADDARSAAATLEATVARLNSPLARMVTHGLLEAIEVRAVESTVTIHLHASREQLEAVFAVVGAMLPAGPDAP